MWQVALHLALAAILAPVPVESPVIPLGPQIRMAQARYVALGYASERGFMPESEGAVSPDVLLEDREALETIRGLIEEWHRYEIRIDPKEADLLVGVRVGKLLTFSGAAVVDGQGPASDVTRRNLRLAGGNPPHVLAVFQASAGRPVTVLWREWKADGLLGPSPVLFEMLRSTVDALVTAP